MNCRAAQVGLDLAGHLERRVAVVGDLVEHGAHLGLGVAGRPRASLPSTWGLSRSAANWPSSGSSSTNSVEYEVAGAVSCTRPVHGHVPRAGRERAADRARGQRDLRHADRVVDHRDPLDPTRHLRPGDRPGDLPVDRHEGEVGARLPLPAPVGVEDADAQRLEAVGRAAVAEHRVGRPVAEVAGDVDARGQPHVRARSRRGR